MRLKTWHKWVIGISVAAVVATAVALVLVLVVFKPENTPACTEKQKLVENKCVALTSADCTDTQKFSGGKCVALTSADCTDTQKFSGGKCVPLTSTDCSDVEKFTGGKCVNKWTKYTNSWFNPGATASLETISSPHTLEQTMKQMEANGFKQFAYTTDSDAAIGVYGSTSTAAFITDCGANCDKFTMYALE